MIEELTGTRKKKQPGYLLWYDDDPKISTVQKIEEALEAYVKSKRWKQRPNIVLVNEADVVDVSDVTVRSTSHVRRNHFWIGREEPVGVVSSDSEEAPAIAAPPIEADEAQAVVVAPEPRVRKTRRTVTAAHIEVAPSITEAISQLVEQPTVTKSRGAKKRTDEIQPVVEYPAAVEATPSRKTPRKAKTSTAELLPPMVEAVVEPVEEQEAPVVEPQPKRSRKIRADTIAARAAELLPPLEEAIAVESQTTRKARGKVKTTAVAEEVLPPVIETPVEEVTPVEPQTTRKARGKVKTTAVAEEVLPPVIEPPVEVADVDSSPRHKTRRSAKTDVVTAEVLPPVVEAPAEIEPARKTRNGVKAKVEAATPAAASSDDSVARVSRTRRTRQTAQVDFEQSSFPL